MRRSAGLLLAGVLVAAPATAGCGAIGSAQASGPTFVVTATEGQAPVRFDYVSTGPAKAVPTVIVPRGSTVVLTVGSDVARRVLVPEQGRAMDVTAGGTVTMRFIALGTFTVRIGETGSERDASVIGTVQPRH